MDYILNSKNLESISCLCFFHHQSKIMPTSIIMFTSWEVNTEPSLVAQLVKNLPAMQKTACNVGDQVWSLDWEDPLEKEMATHSSILAWTIPWTEESGGLESMGFQELNMTEQLNHHHHLLQCYSYCMSFFIWGALCSSCSRILQYIVVVVMVLWW